MTNIRTNLDRILLHVAADPGLNANIPQWQIAAGNAGAARMNNVIARAIEATDANADGRIDVADVMAISDYIQGNAYLYEQFLRGHGDDEGNTESGYHYVQNDGATLQFQGRNFVDTIADGLYHIGFTYQDGRILNEDGNANAELADLAGWLNYFTNGLNIVYGDDEGQTLHSGDYSPRLSAAASELFLAGAGDDRIWAGDGHDTVQGGLGNDKSGGGNGRDEMHGGAGLDTLWGDAGNDRIWGDEGDDKLGGGRGDDALYGGEGHDRIGGDEGRDSIRGENGDDEIWAGDDNDRAYGGNGNDTIGGGRGHDVIQGNGGDDTIWGDQGNDRLAGGAGDDQMGGGDGRDLLMGHDGNDTLSGGDDNDRIFGGAGADSIDGCEGHDILNGGAGDDAIWGALGYDRISGGAGHDSIGGGDGNDRLYGNGGDDGISGHAGHDILHGHDGNDTLKGGEGRDVMRGGTGADMLYGWESSGARDTFAFAAGDSGVTEDTMDQVWGFQHGEDVIDLRSFGALNWRGGAGFTATGGQEARFTGSEMQFDTDGDGSVDMIVLFHHVRGITQDDLLLA